MRFLERIVMSSKPFLIALHVMVWFSMTGCGGAGPLRMKTNPRNLGPWCGPKQRVQIGERVVGRAGWNGNKWKDFLVDDTGKEYDPEKIADQVWSYLERTGDAKKIKEAFTRDGSYPRMIVVSVKPVVVILETYQGAALPTQLGTSPERYYWVAQIHAMGDPVYQERLEWFSLDLKQRPTELAFSEAGVAVIPLPKGKLKLIRDGDKCKTTRE
jgi:hypothetical protein